jgi:hypothetical protein
VKSGEQGNRLWVKSRRRRRRRRRRSRGAEEAAESERERERVKIAEGLCKSRSPRIPLLLRRPLTMSTTLSQVAASVGSGGEREGELKLKGRIE